jgi:hypothetical protein
MRVGIMVFFTVMTVMCVGAYFLLMKLINLSRQHDAGPQELHATDRVAS